MIVLIVIVSAIAACTTAKDKDIALLHEATGLSIPKNVSNVKWQYVRNDNNTYPYLFYSKFKCDSQAYRLILKQVFSNNLVKQANSNLIISSLLLAQEDDFRNAYQMLSWWDVKNKITPNRVWVNYFYDRGNKRIGDSTPFNGKIALFFHDPDYYLFIKCFPPIGG